MTPLHLLVHASDANTATRIEQALRRGDPECLPRIVEDAGDLAARLANLGTAGVVVDADSTPQSTIAPSLRHELNNHLALIRMLAEVLGESRDFSENQRAKIREIGAAAEAAALALRRTKTSA